MHIIPKYCIHILGDDREKIIETLGSISRQNYPNAECVLYVSQLMDNITSYRNVSQIVIQNDWDVLCHISAKKADFQAFVRAGTAYAMNSFWAVNEIFQAFPDIKWLCGNIIPKQNGRLLAPQPLYRRVLVNEHFFENSIDASAVFFAQSLAENISTAPIVGAEKPKSVFDSLWRFFFDFSDLYFTSVYVAYSEEPRSSFSWKRWVLWLLKKKLTANRVKRIIRFNLRTNSYFLSEF